MLSTLRRTGANKATIVDLPQHLYNYNKFIQGCLKNNIVFPKDIFTKFSKGKFTINYYSILIQFIVVPFKITIVFTREILL